MSDAQKQRLLEEFQHYLEQADLEQPPGEAQPDLHALLAEMAGLKAEVKAESRHFKSTLDTLGEALAAVQADNQALAGQLAQHEAHMRQQRNEIHKAMLLELVDVYDRFTVGFCMLQSYRPLALLFSHSKKQDVEFIESFKQGQSMTLRRFEQLLQRHRVVPMDCVGKMLDPHTMSAVEVGHDAKCDNGVVLEELRRGFLFEDQVLRLAEVKVNKL